MINDASGYGRHGTIVGARWMQAMGDNLRELFRNPASSEGPSERVHAGQAQGDDRDPAEMPDSQPAESAATKLAIPDAAGAECRKKAGPGHLSHETERRQDVPGEEGFGGGTLDAGDGDEDRLGQPLRAVRGSGQTCHPGA